VVGDANVGSEDVETRTVDTDDDGETVPWGSILPNSGW
jgi:hypothetical protein